MKKTNIWNVFAGNRSLRSCLPVAVGKRRNIGSTLRRPLLPPERRLTPATAGEVTGSVKLDGAAPKMRTISMAAEPACAKAHTSPVTSEEVVTGDGGALANVVVYVKSGLDGYSFPAPATPVKFEQQGCQYHPHVVGVQVGQNIEVINTDQTTHNIHPIPKENREWNESQPPGAQPIEKTFAREEIAIPVKCNVHPWMKAYMAVLAQSLFPGDRKGRQVRPEESASGHLHDGRLA